MKKATKKATKKAVKKATKKAVQKKNNTAPLDLEAAGILALTSPDQPLDYDIVKASSREELISRVREKLYVAHDGSCWVPQGAAFEEDDLWFQTMAKYD